MEKLKKGLGMKKIGGEEEKKEDEPEEKKATEKTEKKAEKTAKVPEEVEKALQFVALMIAIRGAKAQGEDDEEHVEHAELFHVALVMMLAMFGLISAIQKIVPVLLRWLRRRDRQPEEEPIEEEETPRARGAPTRQAESLRTPESIRRRRRSEIRDDEETAEEEADPGVPFPHGHERGNEILRNWVPGPKAPPKQLAHAYPMPKAMMVAPAKATGANQSASSSTTPAPMLLPPPPPKEPGAETPRLAEEFLGSVVQEPIEHPDDWDEETHGPIGPGKGSPPEAYFRRLQEKGKKGGGAPEKGAGNEKGKKGKIPGDEEGVPKGQIGQKGKEVPMKGMQKGHEGLKGKEKGQEGQAENGEEEEPEPRVPSDEHGVGVPIYLTPWGSRYHTSVTCPTLANSGALMRSPWCPNCCRGLVLTSGTILLSNGPGRTVHVDQRCSGPMRSFPMCQRCLEFDDRY
eukprot:s194_g47.t1